MPTLAYSAGTLTLLVLALYMLHKLRLVHILLHDVRDQSHHDSAGLFRQMEALQGLYVELDLKHSLPPTRGWAASPDILLELARHARSAKPATVVECSSGTSTLVLARCMQMNGAGMVFSLEHDPEYAQLTRAQLRRHGLEDWAQVLYAPLRPHLLSNEKWPWYDISDLPAWLQIDLLVIDGPPQATRSLARYPAGPLLFKSLARGASVFLDDAARPDERTVLQRWQKEFPALDQSSRPCEKGCAVLSVP